MIYQIIQQLKAESSTNAKMKILQDHKDNVDLKYAFEYCLNPFYNYWIRAPKLDTIKYTSSEQLTAGWIVCTLDVLRERTLTGHAARDFIAHQASKLSKEDAEILFNIINHDMDCKVSFGLVNKVWKNLIPKFPVMLSEKYEDYHNTIPEGEIIVQKKEDGGRVQIVVDSDGKVTAYSRSGNILLTHGVFDVIFSKFPGYAFDGELLVLTKGGVADRKTGNGRFTKSVRQTITEAEAKEFHVVLWDAIALEDWKKGFSPVPCKERFKQLKTMLQTVYSSAVSIVPSVTVKTHKEVEEFYLSMLEQNYEGAMVKNPNSPWEDDRVRHCLKMKEEKDATLLVVGVTPHSKRPELIGSLECVTSDNKLKVSIGSGLTDNDREKDPSEFIGSLINMRYNMLITDKNSGMYSMFLPRYDSVCVDKTVADTLKHLKK